MIFRPLYNVENENQSQNPARSNVSNPPIFGTVNPLFEVSLKIQGISRWKLFRGFLKKNNFLTLFYNLFLAICAIFSRFFEDSSKNLKFLDLTLASYFEAYSRGTLESY